MHTLRARALAAALGMSGALGVVGAEPAAAQVPYDISIETASYNPLSGPGSTSHAPMAYALGFAFWDEGVATVALPFSFRWFGTPYSTVYVFTNGFLSFSPVPPGTLNILSAPGTVPDVRNAVHNFIAPMWQDLEAGTNPQIRSTVEGSAPNRRFIVEVSGLRRARTPGSSVAFQVRLEEATSSVRITYDPAGNNGVTQATIAIEDAQGVLGANLFAPSASCGAGCTCTPRGCASFNVLLPTPPLPSDTRAVVIRPPMTAELIGAIRGPAGAYPGTMFSAQVQVSNVGLGAAAASTARIVLSDDTTIDATDRTLLDVAVPPLAGGATFSSTVAGLVMPAQLPVARYYLGVLVDAAAVVTESIEGNNSARDPQGIVTGPDLSATVSAPLASGPGETLPVLLGLRSRGAPWTTPVPVAFFLSEDAVLDGNDRQIHSQSFTMPNGFALDQTVAVTVPTDMPARGYRVLASVDVGDTVVEIDETNNVAVSPGVVTLSLPDLDAAELVAGDTAFRGLPYPIRARVNNRGGSAARAFTVCVVLSRNPLISTVSDDILLRTPPMTVAGAEGAVLRFEPVIPVATGTGAWSLAIVADCDEVVTETQETNNTRRRTDTITVRDPVPDLIPLSVETTPSAAAGEALLTSVNIGNAGPAPGGARVRLVLSENPGATLADPVIYDGAMPVPLDPGREQALALVAQLGGDVRSGRYYVGAIVDPDAQVEEVDETNNIATSAAITVLGSDLAIVSPTPPNAVIGVRYGWRFYAMGGAVAPTWTGTWRDGMAPPGITFDAATGELNGTPTALGSFTLDLVATAGTLVARQSYTLLVTPPQLPLSVVSSRLPPAIQGEDYAVRLVAVGGTPPYTWNLAPGTTAPVGLSVDGLLGGEPSTAGAYTIRVEVTDALGSRVTADVVLDVIDPTVSLTITNVDVPSGGVAETYTVVFDVMGGTSPYTWRLDGRVPGLAFDAGSRQLTGTPTVAGSYPITVEVRDGRGLLDRNAYVVRIFELGELSISTGDGGDSDLPRGVVGRQYATPEGDAITLRAGRRGGANVDGLRWLIALGSLPPGLQLDTASGQIVGTPTASGLFAFTVLAFDGSGDRDRATLVIPVDDPATAPPPIDDGCGCATGQGGGGATHLVWLGVGVVWALRRRRARRASVVASASAVAAGAAIVMMATALSLPAHAQPVPYAVTRELVPYAPLVGATRVTPDLGDGSVLRLPLPFELRLYGQTYRELTINANGVVFASPVGAGHHFPPTRTPDAVAPNGFVAGLWGDWCAGTDVTCGGPRGPADAGIYYRIDTGTPGAGRVTVEYRSLRHFADFVVAGDVNFQITLHEGAAEQIQLHYGNLIPGSSFAGQPTFISGRIGVESPDGRYGTWLAPCDGPSPCGNDLIVGLTNTRLTLLADAGEDVAIGSVAAPAVAYPGVNAPVQIRYVSRHGQPLGPARVAVYLVGAADTSTASGRLLVETEAMTLGPYETRVLDLELPMPADLLPSRRALLVVADPERALVETDEANNVVVSQPIRIAERAPDLSAAAVTPLDARVRPGAALRAAWLVRNGGNERARARAQLYLSANAAVTTSDEPLGAPVELDLAPGATASGTISASVPMPHAVGPHWLGLIADGAGALVELDETNNVVVADAPVVIADDAVVFVTQVLPPATLTRAYEARIEASGGDRAPTFRLTNGALPRGMTFAVDRAQIFGVPLETGTFTVELEAASGGRTVRQSFELVVLDPTLPLTILTRDLPVAVVGSDYVGPVRVVGGTAPLGWRVIGALPPGVDLATDGALVGTPRNAGAYPFVFEVRDNAAHTATIALSIDVRTPGNLTIIDGALERARVGQPYAARLVALGGVAPYLWSPAGELPAGLTLTEAGELVGTPAAQGTFDVAARVTDAAGQSDTNRFALVVEPLGRMSIAVASFERATVGVPYRALLRVDGGRGPFTWAVLEQEGLLPPGITAGPGDPALNESTNDLSLAGTIAEAGLWAFTVRLRDAQGLVAERAFALEAAVPPPPPPPETGGCAATRAPDLGVLVLTFVGLAWVRAARRFRRARRAGSSQESSC